MECSIWLIYQNRRQRLFHRGALRLRRGGLDIRSVIKTPLIHGASYFSFGLGALLGGINCDTHQPDAIKQRDPDSAATGFSAKIS